MKWPDPHWDLSCKGEHQCHILYICQEYFPHNRESFFSRISNHVMKGLYVQYSYKCRTVDIELNAWKSELGNRTALMMLKSIPSAYSHLFLLLT